MTEDARRKDEKYAAIEMPMKASSASVLPMLMRDISIFRMAVAKIA